VPIPTPVRALHPSKLNERRVIAISGGEHHSLFLLSDGSVWGCGRCDGYELGLADDHPALDEVDTRRIANEKRWREKRAAVFAKREKEAIAKQRRRANSISGRHETDSRAQTEEPVQPKFGMVSRTPSYTEQDEWASDKPPPQNEFVMQPVPIPFPPPPSSLHDEEDPPLPPWNDSYYTEVPADPVVHISAGTRHNLAVTRGGYVYAWGFSPQSALGLGRDVEAAKTPTRVKSKAMKGWIVDQIAAGGQHCLALARRPESTKG
jgi:regulator of chromosome condensation